MAYKIYRSDNYIFVTNTSTNESFYGHVKDVFVSKSTTGTSSYRIFNVKEFSSTTSLPISTLLKEDGSAYTKSEFETFYTQNTGNFNSAGTGQGVQSVTGSGVDNTDPQNPVILNSGAAPSINIIEDGNYTIPDGSATKIITFTDNETQTVTLPAIEDSIGVILFITNASSDGISDVNIVSKTGSADIWDGGTPFNSKKVIFGTPVRLLNDGINFKVL